MSGMGRGVLACVAIVGVLVVVAGGAPAAQAGLDGVAWRTTFDGGGGTLDEARAVATDGAGQVFAGGSTDDGSVRETDFAVAAFDGNTGAQRWRVAIDGPGSEFGGVADRVEDLEVDGAGDVVAVGALTSGIEDHGDDFAVVKLDGDTGKQEWRTVLRGDHFGGLAPDVAQALAIGPDGSVYAGGYVQNRGLRETLAVVKLDAASGQVVWRVELNGTAVLHRNRVNAIALDPAGDVIAGGSLVNAGVAEEFTVIKLDDRTGTVMWRTELRGRAPDPGGRLDEAHAVAIDASGNVVAAGITDNGAPTQNDMTVVKLKGASGSIVWTRSLDGAAKERGSDFARDVAVDLGGNVLVGGVLTNKSSGPLEYSVARLNGASGGVLWQRSIRGGELADLLVDGDRVVTAGTLGFGGPSDGDFSVVSFDLASGRIAGRTDLNGTANSFDYGNAVTVGPDGRIVAAGSLSNRGSRSDFTVIKLR